MKIRLYANNNTKPLIDYINHLMKRYQAVMDDKENWHRYNYETLEYAAERLSNYRRVLKKAQEGRAINLNELKERKMRLSDLIAYTKYCLSLGTEPTLYGLRQFRDRGGHKISNKP